MVGGLVRWVVEKKVKYGSEKDKKDSVDKGVLYSAGMIAGEGIIGIFLAVLAVFNIDKVIDLSGIYGNSFQSVGNWVGLAVFALLIGSIFYSCRKKKTVNK